MSQHGSAGHSVPQTLLRAAEAALQGRIDAHATHAHLLPRVVFDPVQRRVRVLLDAGQHAVPCAVWEALDEAEFRIREPGVAEAEAKVAAEASAAAAAADRQGNSAPVVPAPRRGELKRAAPLPHGATPSPAKRRVSRLSSVSRGEAHSPGPSSDQEARGGDVDADDHVDGDEDHVEEEEGDDDDDGDDDVVVVDDVVSDAGAGVRGAAVLSEDDAGPGPSSDGAVTASSDVDDPDPLVELPYALMGSYRPYTLQLSACAVPESVTPLRTPFLVPQWPKLVRQRSFCYRRPAPAAMRARARRSLVYWVSGCPRVQDNLALRTALFLSKQLCLPLSVIAVLPPAREMSRARTCLLRGLAEMAHTLRDTFGVPMLGFLSGDPAACVAALCEALFAHALLLDETYDPALRVSADAVAAAVPALAVYSFDSEHVVPIRYSQAADADAFAAQASLDAVHELCREWAHVALPAADTPGVAMHAALYIDAGAQMPFVPASLSRIADRFDWPVVAHVPGNHDGLRGGESEAQQVLRAFLENGCRAPMAPAYELARYVGVPTVAMHVAMRVLSPVRVLCELVRLGDHVVPQAVFTRVLHDLAWQRDWCAAAAFRRPEPLLPPDVVPGPAPVPSRCSAVWRAVDARLRRTGVLHPALTSVWARGFLTDTGGEREVMLTPASLARMLLRLSRCSPSGVCVETPAMLLDALGISLQASLPAVVPAAAGGGAGALALSLPPDAVLVTLLQV